MIATDKEIFGPDDELRIRTKGRPKVNRDLARRLIEADYKTSQIAKALRCSSKTVRRIKAELIESGELNPEEMKDRLDIVEADFDEECIRATGISFHSWLKNRTVNHTTIFNFSRRTWDTIWGRPSLVLTKDPNQKIGDTLCQKFLEVFREDNKRIRRRKSLIRYLFRYLGRHDLCDRHLTMTKSRDPKRVRRIPQISMTDFPRKLVECFDLMYRELGDEVETALMFKLVSQMRTGKGDKGLMGIRVGSNGESYLIMSSPDEYRCSVLEKMNEQWDITWIPRDVRERLYKVYLERDESEKLFSFKISTVTKSWRAITEKIVGVGMTLHDLRKVGITWLYVMGLPLEIATSLNCGWKDLNTPRDHYLDLRRLLKKSEKQAYREQIPMWYKEGLEEYMKEE